MTIRSGDLPHRVEWTSYTISNVSGQAKPTYTSNGSFWAAVEPLSGREGLIAVQQRADVTHKVTMRNVGNIKPTDRLIYKTRILEITSVLNQGELGAELTLICLEKVE